MSKTMTPAERRAYARGKAAGLEAAARYADEVGAEAKSAIPRAPNSGQASVWSGYWATAYRISDWCRAKARKAKADARKQSDNEATNGRVS